MSSVPMQQDAAGVPGGDVASFLQLSFNPQLLDRVGAAGSGIHRQPQSSKPAQQAAAGAQRPPLPPPAKAAAAAPIPTVNNVLPVEQQHQQQQPANSVSVSAARQRLPEQAGLHQQMPAPMPQPVVAAAPAAPPATAEQSNWMQQPGIAPGMDPEYQQYAQQYMQYDAREYAAAATAAAFPGGYSSIFPAANAYDAAGYQAAGYYGEGYGYEAAAAGQASYADAGVNGRAGAGRGRAKGRSRRTSSEPNSEEDEDYTERPQQQPAAKRRKKEQPALEAESQLLLLGFVSAVVGDNPMLEQCLVHAVSFETQQEAMLQQQMMMMGVEAVQPPPKVSVLKQYQLAQSLAKNVRSRAALSLVWQLPVAFSSARSMLAVGGVFTLEDVCRECATELTALMTSFDFEAAGLRKSKVEGQVEALNDMLKDTMEQLLVEAGHIPDKLPAQRAAQPSKPLPRCIVENREPFAHKEWRKEPYDPRPYVNLTDYAITSNVPREAKQLKWKLSTRRRDGAGDGFAEKHHDLTPEQLKEKEQHIVEQVLHRKALVKNRDVIEVDCWGMDCYTRRNVFDAVLEANVFKHLRGEQQQQQPGQQAEGNQQQLVKAEFEQQQPAGDVTHPEHKENVAVTQQQQPAAAEAAADKPADVVKQAVPRSEQQQQQVRQEQQHLLQDQQLAMPQQQQQEAQQQQQLPRDTSPTPASEAPAVHAAGQQQHHQQQPDRGSADPADGSPESGAGGEEEGQRKSKRARKRVMYADEAMEELKAQAREHKKANREALLAKHYPTPRENYSKAEEDAVHEWIDDVFLPAVNAAGNQGWDMVRVATNIREQAEAQGNQINIQAAEAVLIQFNNSGYPWFRLHPKGRGVIVTQPEGVAPFTFVEEYLGEVHTGWRWFEIQDAIKKITQKDLPDFYNIALERPRDDPDGYDILFVDAAFMGSFASRMSHSCTPNCQAVVVSSGGRLTVALYTIRHVAPGEELTFDYSSVTESEDEFKQAYCMCSTRHCRGSYLYYTGSKAYMQVLETKHTFLDRQALLLRCCTEPLTEADKARLDKAGLRGSVLGRPDVDCNPETPDWLKKWAAVTLEFVELERQLLPGELQALPPPLTQSAADSIAAAVGVELNRLQNICISLDKAKHCLNQPGQCKDPPLALLSDEEVAEYLWSGERSVAKRAVKAAASQILDAEDAEMVQAATTVAEYQAAAQHVQFSYPLLANLLTQLTQTVTGAEAARTELQRVVAQLRDIDIVMGGGHTRAADVLQLYASTQVWFTANRDYISFSSPPLQLHEEMITMHGGLDAAVDPKKGVRRSNSGTGLGHTGASSGGGSRRRRRDGDSSDDDEYDPDASSEDEEAVRKRGANRGRGRWGGAAGRGGAGYKPVKGINPKVLEKRYGPHYVWAQLSSWFKQTVYDPTASLSADRRGTLSLPEVESCYTTKEKYDAKERQRLINHVLKTPERQWTSSAWSFRNEAKVYGSPMFDAFWGELVNSVPRDTCLEQLAETLRSASVPYGLAGGGKGGKGSKGAKKGKGGKAASSAKSGRPGSAGNTPVPAAAAEDDEADDGHAAAEVAGEASGLAEGPSTAASPSAAADDAS